MCIKWERYKKSSVNILNTKRGFYSTSNYIEQMINFCGKWSHRSNFGWWHSFISTSKAWTLCQCGLSPSVNFTNNDKKISHSVICQKEYRYIYILYRSMDTWKVEGEKNKGMLKIIRWRNEKWKLKFIILSCINVNYIWNRQPPSSQSPTGTFQRCNSFLHKYRI